MDRFIESVEQSAENVVDNLKSNMDRFIEIYGGKDKPIYRI